MSLASRLLGIPMTAQEREAVFAEVARGRTPEDVLAFFRDGAQHNTAKSGALLGAQGIFVVVDIFALDHGWPRLPVLAAMLTMLAGALLVMANLRGTLSPYQRSAASKDADGMATARATYALVHARSLRFNVALYLTFVSVLLLAISALTLLRR
jgi:hypothetical protein